MPLRSAAKLHAPNTCPTPPALHSCQVNKSLAAEREAKKSAEMERALVQIELEAKQRRLTEVAAAAQARTTRSASLHPPALSASAALCTAACIALPLPCTTARSVRALGGSPCRGPCLVLTRPLPASPSAPQKQAEEAMSQLAEANSKYKDVLEQLAAARQAGTKTEEVRLAGV